MSRVTLRDVAERAGVSTAAISQALNDRGSLRPETRERIKAIAAELGYTPNKHAAALRSGRTMSIGFVMPAVDDATAKSWAFAHNLQLNALVRASAEHGFTVTVLPASRPDLLATPQLDALYLADARTGAELLRAAASRGLPVIARDLYVDVDRALSIRTGYDAALRAALDHLSATGAERIALLVDEGDHPRDEIARSGYLAWSTVHGADPLVIELDAAHRTLPRRVRDAVDAGADAILAFCEDGPEIYLQLEAMPLVIPRDVQLLALCSTDCALNERLGVTHVCVHPELAADAVFPSLGALVPSPGGAPRVVDLPWELVRGSTTR
ncbi:LacI family DNA-binding transcriptional regulator [Microbacterium lacticum]|uniref:DNA-binding LacI/PurR family transcriptional regulator n=1 Tax=Microbacterium lacticum TaxID=33885 RepID=A0A4Y3UQ75_9MICO|nr:LacI family DNA-binding transcriptional regulator [Microbacterium lacticum]TQN01007.1 DNA-binding LacI/PurR family transcriptional regulator [Microbacterium lacticum]GEB95649.1 LacI family transcriptional regulator [Microbacterium lacticum]GGI68245.1 LacI family transcriptional regulator [Microbacterium lacticum]